MFSSISRGKSGGSRKKALLRATPAALIGLFLILIISSTAVGTGVLMRASTDSAGGQVEGSSNYPSISADGRYVAFNSDAADIVYDDINGVRDIFIKDTRTGATTMVSTNQAGVIGNGHSYRPSISADGRYVAFDSAASNLVAGDNNGIHDVFWKDTQTGDVVLVSVAEDGTQGNNGSYYPSISADGRYVAFHSHASNLVPDDMNGVTDVFVKDTRTGALTRVSVTASGGNGDNWSGDPSISADGRYVAFDSTAANLVQYDTNAKLDIFVNDTSTGVTIRVSTNSAAGQVYGHSYEPSISADGRYVVFHSRADDLAPGGSPGTLDIFLKDTQTGSVTLLSTDFEGGPSDNDSWRASVSATGRYVAYTSYATDIVPGDTNRDEDVFVTDALTGNTTRVSTNASGAQGNDDSDYASISQYGFYVAYESEAWNLVPGDTNGRDDVFVATAADCSGEKPGLSLSKTNVRWGSYADYQNQLLTVDYRISNSLATAAVDVTIVGSASTNSVTVATPLPLQLGYITIGGNATYSLKYNTPPGVGAFTTNTYVTARNSCGNFYEYPGPYPSF
ncbi:protein TolB [bacterium BMS3Abin01]|nr:protein TolB [bacterium BMS3Abin01]